MENRGPVVPLMQDDKAMTSNNRPASSPVSGKPKSRPYEANGITQERSSPAAHIVAVHISLVEESSLPTSSNPSALKTGDQLDGSGSADGGLGQ